MISRHIIITGKVQGVFFRKHTKQKATELNVTGWVKNVEDNKVEIFVQGNKADVHKFLEWCRQGPPKAEVADVHVEEKQTDNNLKEFLIVYED